MRRVTFTVFALLAACGGTDMVNQSAKDSSAADRQAFLMTPGAHAVVASFAQESSQSALETCLNAWIQEANPSRPNEGPVPKPDVAGLRAFLAQCLGVSGEGDARSSGRTAALSDIPVVHPIDKGSSR